MRLVFFLAILGHVAADALPEIPPDIGPQASAELFAAIGISITGLVMLWGSFDNTTRMWIRKGKIPFEAFKAWWASKGVTIAHQDPSDPDNNYVLDAPKSRVEAILNQ